MSLEGPMKGPLTQLTINACNWLVLNFFPPVFPLAEQWSRFLEHTLSLSADAVRSLSVPPLALGEGECLGMGVSLLLLVSAFASRVSRRQGHHGAAKLLGAYWKILLWSSWFALLVFGLKAQVVFSSSRLLTPYYAILIAPILVFTLTNGCSGAVGGNVRSQPFLCSRPPSKSSSLTGLCGPPNPS